MKRIRIISLHSLRLFCFFSQTRVSNYKIVASLEFTLIRESNCIRCWAWWTRRRSSWGKDIVEKNITLEITKKVQDYLQEQGALVILTRDGDYDLAQKDTKSYSRRKAEDLKKRVEIINKPDIDFLRVFI